MEQYARLFRPSVNLFAEGKEVGMNSFASQLIESYPPEWVEEIKGEARMKITATTFAAACRKGNSAVMRGVVLALWPFVDTFPKSIIRAASGFPKRRILKDRQLLNMFLHRGPQMLSGIRKDEENHRALWLETGRALGLNYPLDFERPVLPHTQVWINEINNKSDPLTSLLRFAGIEILAEAISVDLLSSQTFTSVLGNRGCEWFRVHAEHEPGMTHEELLLRTAFFIDKHPTKENVNSVIQHVVNLFIRAGEACEPHVEAPTLWVPKEAWTVGKTPTRHMK